ncbi:hypothetical protein NM688_g11 [Phlebia brevispora]|uniref:Uncharacterized protein n=1 Tax=Phlebia brevispora TaxID=194682 RepID=A0ACC1TFP2_9APHY|nr:hypothetical protein NM688_g11 [Phlebia brevispora]
MQTIVHIAPGVRHLFLGVMKISVFLALLRSLDASSAPYKVVANNIDRLLFGSKFSIIKSKDLIKLDRRQKSKFVIRHDPSISTTRASWEWQLFTFGGSANIVYHALQINDIDAAPLCGVSLEQVEHGCSGFFPVFVLTSGFSAFHQLLSKGDDQTSVEHMSLQIMRNFVSTLPSSGTNIQQKDFALHRFSFKMYKKIPSSWANLSNHVLAAVQCSVFPVEIFYLVIDCADHTQMRDLSLVSRSFRKHSAPRLFTSMQVVAGLRCIQWTVESRGPTTVYHKKLTPDTFPVAISALTHDLPAQFLGYATKLSVRGLGDSERQLADTKGGSGDNPYLTLCMLKKILCFFPAVTDLVISNVIWADCMEKILSPDHSCCADFDKRNFSAVTLFDVTHNNIVDSVFDALELATTCLMLAIKDVEWEHSVPVPLFSPRLTRPDIRRLDLYLSDVFTVNRQLARKYPVLTNLTHLELRRVSDLDLDAVYDLIDGNKRSLETFVIDVGRRVFSFDEWVDLPLFLCDKLHFVHIILELCLHPPHRGCAGSQTLTAFVQCLPESVQKLHIRTIEATAAVNTFRQITTIPDWPSLLPVLKQLVHLRIIQLSISQLYPFDRPASFMEEWVSWLSGELSKAKVALADASFDDNEFVA